MVDERDAEGSRGRWKVFSGEVVKAAENFLGEYERLDREKVERRGRVKLRGLGEGV